MYLNALTPHTKLLWIGDLILTNRPILQRQAVLLPVIKKKNDLIVNREKRLQGSEAFLAFCPSILLRYLLDGDVPSGIFDMCSVIEQFNPWMDKRAFLHRKIQDGNGGIIILHHGADIGER